MTKFLKHKILLSIGFVGIESSVEKMRSPKIVYNCMESF